MGLALLAAVGWFGYGQYSARVKAARLAQQPVTSTSVSNEADKWQLPATSPKSQFACDGREHCSQMSSCEEAKFFIRNCPDTKMDGDGDGVPCEQQLCGG